MNETPLDKIDDPVLSSAKTPRSTDKKFRFKFKQKVITSVLLIIWILITAIFIFFIQNNNTRNLSHTNPSPSPTPSPNPIPSSSNNIPKNSFELNGNLKIVEDPLGEINLVKNGVKHSLFKLKDGYELLSDQQFYFKESDDKKYLFIKPYVRRSTNKQKIEILYAVIDLQKLTAKKINEAPLIPSTFSTDGDPVWVDDTLFYDYQNNLRYVEGDGNTFDYTIADTVVKQFNAKSEETRDIIVQKDINKITLLKTPDNNLLFYANEAIYKYYPYDESLARKEVELSTAFHIPTGTSENYLYSPHIEFEPVDETNEYILFVSNANEILLLNSVTFTLDKIGKLDDYIDYVKASPDRKKIAVFLRTNDSESKLLSIETSNFSKVNLLNTSAPFASINWSPDGKYLQSFETIYDVEANKKLTIAYDACSGGGWSAATNAVWSTDSTKAAIHDCFDDTRSRDVNGGWKIYDLSSQKETATVPDGWIVQKALGAEEWKIVQFKEDSSQIEQEKIIDNKGKIYY